MPVACYYDYYKVFMDGAQETSKIEREGFVLQQLETHRIERKTIPCREININRAPLPRT